MFFLPSEKLVERLSRIKKQSEVFLQVLQVFLYFDEPIGLIKIQTTSKNTQQYYTPKCLISYTDLSPLQMVLKHNVFGIPFQYTSSLRTFSFVC